MHNEAFNVGGPRTTRFMTLPSIVEKAVPGQCRAYAPGGEPDIRDYRVSFAKFARAVPSFRPRWTLVAGVEQLYVAFMEHGLTPDALTGPRFIRLQRIRELMAAGRLDPDLRLRNAWR